MSRLVMRLCWMLNFPYSPFRFTIWSLYFIHVPIYNVICLFHTRWYMYQYLYFHLSVYFENKHWNTKFFKTTLILFIPHHPGKNSFYAPDQNKYIPLEDAPKVVNGKQTFCFTQPVPIQSYLIAIAAGAMVSKRIGPRSGLS